ncbi:MAG: YqgE/AlgH family protein [Hyphomicrobiales bacterium]|nr:YqgE/AlgH family protein [Hyphomicrobiales bacterium]
MRALLALLLLLLPAVPAAAEGDAPAGNPPPGGRSLAGWLLVAEPRLADPNFARTVVFLVEHDAQGAMGLILNRVVGEGHLGAFLKGFDIELEAEDRPFRLHAGGPVSPGLGFVLHSPDFQSDEESRRLGDFVMTTHLDVLRALARGKGPRHSLFAMGYAGWGPGQVEAEIARGDWTYLRADTDLVFGTPPDRLWARAHVKAGLSL